MNIFIFANSTYLYFLIIIPILILLYLISAHNKKKALNKYGESDVIAQLMPDISNIRSKIKFWIFIFAYTLLIFALARPQFGAKLKEVKRKGIEVIIALDVSNSMMAEDLKPNRLERAKQAISQLVDRLRDDKIGLIVFAGDAYIQIPITTDYGAAKMFLSNISTSIVPKQGTAIGSAIQLATRSFGPDEDVSKAIIIITDGENHEDDAITMTEAAVEKGIIVNAIGMGLPKGVPIPYINRYGQKDFMKDRSGQVVVSKLNEKMLNEIAITGKGKYIRATSSQIGLNQIFEKIEKLKETEYEAKMYSEYEERFAVLIWIALALLILEFIIMERKNKYFKNIHLFKLNE